MQSIPWISNMATLPSFTSAAAYFNTLVIRLSSSDAVQFLSRLKRRQQKRRHAPAMFTAKSAWRGQRLHRTLVLAVCVSKSVAEIRQPIYNGVSAANEFF